MKKLCVLALVFLMAMTTLVVAGGMRGSTQTPDVRYLLPRNDHEVDLTGKDSLTFEWLTLPKPGGGRRAYRFELFRGAEEAYSRIYHADLRHDVCTIEVPADTFEDGMMYTWRVKQQDAASSVWSRAGDRWRFTVIKK